MLDHVFCASFEDASILSSISDAILGERGPWRSEDRNPEHEDDLRLCREFAELKAKNEKLSRMRDNVRDIFANGPCPEPDEDELVEFEPVFAASEILIGPRTRSRVRCSRALLHVGRSQIPHRRHRLGLRQPQPHSSRRHVRSGNPLDRLSPKPGPGTGSRAASCALAGIGPGGGFSGAGVWDVAGDAGASRQFATRASAASFSNLATGLLIIVRALRASPRGVSVRLQAIAARRPWPRSPRLCRCRWDSPLAQSLVPDTKSKLYLSAFAEARRMRALTSEQAPPPPSVNISMIASLSERKMRCTPS